jgi:uncharacterized protein YjbI with pentapeptide repeats
VKAGSGTSWLVGITLLALVGGLIIYSYADWPGAQYFGIADKEFWDYLELLIVPAALAFGVYWLNRTQDIRQQEADRFQQQLQLEHNQMQQDRALETVNQQQQDAALRAYLDQMSQLLLDKYRPLRQSEEGDEVRTLARARTLTVLTSLDGNRRRTVVQFLYESRLIDKDSCIVDLTGAVLARAILTGANLEGVSLRGTHLPRASLRDAKLSEADLSDAKLFGADLSRAKLNRANLRGPVLMSKGYGTPLPRASSSLRAYTLEGAGPKNADLSDTTLWDADLTNAYVSKEQLRSDNSTLTLKGATMPNGQKYEDWLKSKDRKEDG